jgi:transcriptional regulator with XRE-family HTH domain
MSRSFSHFMRINSLKMSNMIFFSQKEGIIMSSLGERLRTAREKSGFKQTQVFEKTKINNKTLSRYENDGSEPDKDTLTILADLYGVSIDWLYGRTDDPKPKNANSIIKTATEMKNADALKEQSALYEKSGGRAYFGGADQYTEEELDVAKAAIEAYRSIKRKDKK